MPDNISFEEERVKITSQPASTGLIGFLINKCGVRTESAANVILVVISIIMLSLTVLVLKSALS